MSTSSNYTQGVYLIFNRVNGKKYVGRTTGGHRRGFITRWNEHKLLLNRGIHCNRHLQASWIKHGACNFLFFVLESTPPSTADVTEQKWMDLLRPEYNILKYVNGCFARVFSEETRRKISLSKQGKPGGMTGKSHSAETRRLISLGNTGKTVTTSMRRAVACAASRPVYALAPDGTRLSWASGEYAAWQLNRGKTTISRWCARKGSKPSGVFSGWVFAFDEGCL